MAILFCDPVAPREIAQRAGLDKGAGVGVEDVVVARGCARSWTADQIDAIKDLRGRLADEGAGSVKTSCTASGLWYRDSW